MLELPVIKLPVELTHLLKIKLYNDKESINTVAGIITSSPSLNGIVLRSFQEFGKQGGLINIITTLGWKHFRDRLISLYIYKRLFGRYPERTDIHLVSELSDLEDQMQSFSLESNSRLMLFLFYLKNVEYYQREHGNQFKISKELEKVFDLLSLSTAKNSKIDWLMLITMHLVSFYQIEDLEGKIADGLNFRDLFQMMSEDQKKIFINNSLSYGCSIQDDELFFQQVI